MRITGAPEVVLCLSQQIGDLKHFVRHHTASLLDLLRRRLEALCFLACDLFQHLLRRQFRGDIAILIVSFDSAYFGLGPIETRRVRDCVRRLSLKLGKTSC
ncbi:hypothetical protein [Rhizobium skierniewicense]|uniref:hypothetical protein n=1 Tax=Rhizobium skierniewicense TaxID=984260 RepID=UPI001573A066|nr:hypothetical protein [Rhizobium skierniewicense]NTF31793.1 hypothetical protein [Rhizobium skierniewicense]